MVKISWDSARATRVDDAINPMEIAWSYPVSRRRPMLGVSQAQGTLHTLVELGWGLRKESGNAYGGKEGSGRYGKDSDGQGCEVVSRSQVASSKMSNRTVAGPVRGLLWLFRSVSMVTSSIVPSLVIHGVRAAAS